MGLPKLQATPWLLLTLRLMQRKENKCSFMSVVKNPNLSLQNTPLFYYYYYNIII